LIPPAGEEEALGKRDINMPSAVGAALILTGILVAELMGHAPTAEETHLGA